MRYFQPTSLTCLLEPWLRELGFSIFFSSILIKLYRILTEFQTRKAHRVCLRDKDQVIYLLAVVFIVIGYMSAWTALMVDGFFVSRSISGNLQFAGVVDNLQLLPDRMATTEHNASWRRSSGTLDETLELSTETETTLTSSTRDIVNEHLEILTRGLDSFGELFLGLLESVQSYDSARQSLVFVIRCRKLTWDYVTESSKFCWKENFFLFCFVLFYVFGHFHFFFFFREALSRLLLTQLYFNALTKQTNKQTNAQVNWHYFCLAFTWFTSYVTQVARFTRKS